MTTKTKLKALKAIAQKNRLTAVLMLQKKKKGLFPSDMASKMKIHPTLLSHHLGLLLSAGWITKKREGKYIRYFSAGMNISL